MTNEEIKKKIISVLQSVEFVTEKGWCGQCISLRLDYSAIADALIAAGVGDVKEAELERKAYEVASNQYRIWFEEQKDRAERAERALMTVCTNVIKDEEDDLAIEPRARVLYKAYLNQAKKELTEEEKE